MNLVNAFLGWIEARLAAGWFQYGYIGVATVFEWDSMRWAEGYTITALAAKADPVGTAAVVAAVTGVGAGVMAFAFKHHLENKDGAQ